MVSTIQDRFNIVPEEGIKAPCRMATTANVTLSGLQTIDDVSGAEADRVLVRSQTAASENGIYVMQLTAWVRASDWDDNTDVVSGILVPISNGTLYANTIWTATFSGTFSIDSTGPVFTTSSQTGATTIDVDTVAIMAAQSLGAGQMVRTKGFTTAGGIGGGLYYVKTEAERAAAGDVVDERSVVTLANGNFAVLQTGWAMGIPTSGAHFGMLADDSTDDTAACQAAIAYSSRKGGGSVRIPDGGVVFDSDLDVLQNVDLVSSHEYIDFTDRDYWGIASQRILLNSTATIKLRNGAGLKGLLVYRKGMTFPAAGLTVTEVALYAGTAVTVLSASPYIRHCTFLGFTRAIDTDSAVNTPRGRMEFLNIDCTNGVRIDLDLGSWTLDNVFCHPFLSNTDADNIRTGIGFDLKNRSDWTTLNGCFAFQDTGFKLTACNQIKFINCMADHPTDGTDTFHTGTGFDISGDSVDNFFIGCQTASHNRGWDQDVSDGNANYLSDCHMWNMNSSGFGVVVEGGDLHINGGRIGEFFSSSGKGIFVGDVNSKVYVNGGTHFIGLATAIDSPTFSQVIVDPSCTFETISSSIRTNEALPQVASAGTITLPNNVPVVELTGTTTIGTIGGANRLPHETVTLIFAGNITVNHGATGVRLNGSANQAFTTGSTLTLVYTTGNVWYETGRMIA